MVQEIKCSCGTLNDASSKYCKHCNTPFGTEWKKQKNEFAVYIPPEHYQRSGQDSIIIPFGSKGLIFEDGQLVESIESGKYSLKKENFLIRLFKGGKSYSVFILDAGNVSLGFNYKKIYTKDNVSVDLNLEIEFGCDNPSLFFINLMKNEMSFTVDDFRPVFFSEVKNILDSNLKRYSFQDLDTGLQFKKELGSYLASELRVTCQNNGLDLRQVKSISFTQEFMEKLRERKETLKEKEATLKLDGEDENLKKIETDMDVQKMSGQIHRTKEIGSKGIEHDLVKADLIRERIKVFKALQEADTEKIKSKEAFRKFKLEIDRENALDDAEWQEFERELLWKKEDQTRDRQFLVKKIEIQQSHEVKRLELLENKNLSIEEKKAQYEILDLELKNELSLQFKKIEGLAQISKAEIEAEVQNERIKVLGKKQTEIKLAADEMELKKKNFAMEMEQSIDKGKTQFELDKMELKLNELKSELGMTIREKKDAQDLKNKAELQVLDSEKQHDELDRKLRKENAEHEREIALIREKARVDQEKMQGLTKLNIEQLISVSDQGKAAILGDLAKTEALKGRSADEIMATTNQEAYKEALVERAKQSNTDKEKALYERMISMMEANTQNLSNAHKESADRTDRVVDKMQDIAVEGMRATSGQNAAIDTIRQTESDKKEQIYERSMDRVASVEKVRASSGTAKSGTARVLVCKTCKHEIDADANNCNNCGEKVY